jgi:hypothetical protein
MVVPILCTTRLASPLLSQYPPMRAGLFGLSVQVHQAILVKSLSDIHQKESLFFRFCHYGTHFGINFDMPNPFVAIVHEIEKNFVVFV